MSEFSLCKVCGAFDTCVSTGDCDGCSECYSIEQGFIWLDQWEHDNLLIDENGFLYDDEFDIIGVEYNYKVGMV